MYYRYSTLLEQRSTSKLGIHTPLSSYISSFLHDDLENDNLGNDDLENDDLENDDLENDDLEKRRPRRPRKTTTYKTMT